jgi:hypothetical protein
VDEPNPATTTRDRTLGTAPGFFAEIEPAPVAPALFDLVGTDEGDLIRFDIGIGLGAGFVADGNGFGDGVTAAA